MYPRSKYFCIFSDKNLELKFTRSENFYSFLFYHIHPPFLTTVDFSLIKSIIFSNYTRYFLIILLLTILLSIIFSIEFAFFRTKEKKEKKKLKRIFYSCSIYIVYHFNCPIKVLVSSSRVSSTPLLLTGNNYQPLLQVSLQHIGTKACWRSRARIRCRDLSPWRLLSMVSRERCLCTHGVFH